MAGRWNALIGLPLNIILAEAELNDTEAYYRDTLTRNMGSPTLGLPPGVEPSDMSIGNNGSLYTMANLNRHWHIAAFPYFERARSLEFFANNGSLRSCIYTPLTNHAQYFNQPVDPAMRVLPVSQWKLQPIPPTNPSWRSFGRELFRTKYRATMRYRISNDAELQRFFRRGLMRLTDLLSGHDRHYSITLERDANFDILAFYDFIAQCVQLLMTNSREQNAKPNVFVELIVDDDAASLGRLTRQGIRDIRLKVKNILYQENEWGSTFLRFKLITSEQVAQFSVADVFHHPDQEREARYEDNNLLRLRMEGRISPRLTNGAYSCNVDLTFLEKAAAGTTIATYHRIWTRVTHPSNVWDRVGMGPAGIGLTLRQAFTMNRILKDIPSLQGLSNALEWTWHHQWGVRLSPRPQAQFDALRGYFDSLDQQGIDVFDPPDEIGYWVVRSILNLQEAVVDIFTNYPHRAR